MTDTKMDWAQFQQAAPAVVATLRNLTKVIADSGLEKPLTELLKVRASQLNGCAFCLGLHVEFARKAGVSQQALDLVAAWREAGIFTPRERAALAWTEALTLMAHQPVPDELYEQVCVQFPTAELAFLTASIGLINAWNRIAGGLRFAPG
jgi:AhpD family alkylhydroperoxidase